jgi:hypothetical protein
LEQDEEKENMTPRRKARKAVIGPPPLEFKPMVPIPDPKKRLVGKAKFTPATPWSKQAPFSAQSENAAPRTPQRLDSDTVMSSLFVTPILTADQRKERRRMLEEEANVAESTDEELL